jgi:KDO2-lipid IV(A) lauroyltransferase
MALAQRKLHRTNWRQHVQLENARQLVSQLLSERPVVVVTAHLGNFELSGYIAGLFGFPTYTIARRLDNPYLDRFLRKFRQRTGQTIVHSSGTAELAQAVLETGATLAILGDHHAGRKGCWVDFLGRPASCHKSVALFSLANDIPLLVIVTTRQSAMMRFVMKLVAVYDPQQDSSELRGVQELTQWYNRHLELQIREYPDQYWWLHRRWKKMDEIRVRNEPSRQPSLTAHGR